MDEITADGKVTSRFDYGAFTDDVLFHDVNPDLLRLLAYLAGPEIRPPSAEPPGLVEVLPEIPPLEFPGPPPPCE